MCDVDFGTEVGKIHQAAPFISITGIAGNNCQVFLCGEGDKFFESTSLKEAMIDIIIVVLLCLCPKLVNSILLFFQHYVFKMTKLVGNLNKLCYVTSYSHCLCYIHRMLVAYILNCWMSEKDCIAAEGYELYIMRSSEKSILFKVTLSANCKCRCILWFWL